MSQIGALTPTLLYRRPLLDRLGVTGTAAYGLRRLRYGYWGKCCNIRRSSDNATQDIGFTAAGDFDTASFSAFIGGGSGFVAKWYDQSGNGNDAAQATAANQPQLVLNATPSGKPALQSASGSGAFLSTPAITQAQPYTFAAAVQRVSGTATANFIGASGVAALFLNSVANQAGLNAGANIVFSAADAVFHSIIGVLNGGSSTVNIDGTSTGGNAGTNNFSAAAISLFNTTAAADEVNLSEAFFFPGALTTAQQSALISNQRAWGGW